MKRLSLYILLLVGINTQTIFAGWTQRMEEIESGLISRSRRPIQGGKEFSSPRTSRSVNIQSSETPSLQQFKFNPETEVKNPVIETRARSGAISGEITTRSRSNATTEPLPYVKSISQSDIAKNIQASRNMDRSKIPLPPTPARPASPVETTKSVVAPEIRVKPRLEPKPTQHEINVAKSQAFNRSQIASMHPRSSSPMKPALPPRPASPIHRGK